MGGGLAHDRMDGRFELESEEASLTGVMMGGKGGSDICNAGAGGGRALEDDSPERAAFLMLFFDVVPDMTVAAAVEATGLVGDVVADAALLEAGGATCARASRPVLVE